MREEEKKISAAARRIAQCAQKALLYEVSVTPKPGLVDRNGCGAHRDMDFFTFLDSAVVLLPYFETCADEADPGTLTEEILRTAGRIAAPALEDFSNDKADETAGLAAHRADGCRGVRGEAAAGFPSVRDCSLPMLRNALDEGHSLNDAGAEALLHLILCVEDTTLLKRCGGREARDLEREKIRQLLTTETALEAAARLDADWSARGLSAGGCADLLGCACFLLFIENGSDIIIRTVK